MLFCGHSGFCQGEGSPSLVWGSPGVLYRASGKCSYHQLRSGWFLAWSPRVALIEPLFRSHCSLSSH